MTEQEVDAGLLFGQEGGWFDRAANGSTCLTEAGFSET